MSRADTRLFRLTKLKESLRRRKIDAFLITDINNVRYLTGFSGSSAIVLITEDENIFVTDFRYKEQAEKEIEGWNIVIEKEGALKTIKTLSKKIGIKEVGFESSAPYEFFKKLSILGLNPRPFKGLIEKLRAVKDTTEIDLIKEAIRRAESAFLEVKPYIREGTKEREIALRLEERLKEKGCRFLPFDIIVASGANSALPHVRPTEKRLSPGDLVVIDWGGEAGGYFSDMTRTFLIKDGDSSKKREIYQLVLEANRKAISCISPGVRSCEVDSCARNIIKKAGYGEFFGHGVGHGVGLQIHESPRITWNKKEVIKENMVFTIEPGIYVSGIGGVRIEDMVVVKPDGATVLTGLPKELEII